jgi:hypothetical protein
MDKVHASLLDAWLSEAMNLAHECALSFSISLNASDSDHLPDWNVAKRKLREHLARHPGPPPKKQSHAACPECNSTRLWHVPGCARFLLAVPRPSSPLADLVERLRRAAPYMTHKQDRDIFSEAADEIERLTAENARDCRLCANFTTKAGGCIALVQCVDADGFEPTSPRQYWMTKP